ncbi:MAG: helix-turn-helix domain-containing protein [Gemmatimonadota bacterium]
MTSRWAWARGLTQMELGDGAGLSQRMIACYESESAQPPDSFLVELASVLKVSTDELLGLDQNGPRPQDRAAPQTPAADRRAPCR